MTKDFLLQESANLTKLEQHLSLIETMLSQFEYAREKNDKISVQFAVNRGEFSLINENIKNIKEEIGRISDSICPDFA